jgi:curli production assembly/transport component CsgF
LGIGLLGVKMTFICLKAATRFLSCVAIGVVFLVGSAFADQLVYKPVNPSFGGSPLNGGYLLDSAKIQNKHVESSASSLGKMQTPAERFIATLQSRLLYQVASNITDSIFGENAQQSGQFQFEGTTISFVREGPNVRLIINDGLSETEILVPAGT